MGTSPGSGEVSSSFLKGSPRFHKSRFDLHEREIYLRIAAGGRVSDECMDKTSTRNCDGCGVRQARSFSLNISASILQQYL